MPKKNLNVSLTSYDDIFSTEESRIEEKQEKVQEIALSELHPFKNHPFKVLDDEEMEKTVESISEYGVLTPAIARPRTEGGYELISGHRRHHASELAGLETMPVIVRDMDDDSATILMIDSNLQRETILPSERAWAYRLKKEAVERTLGRPKNEGQVVPNYFRKRTTEIIGESVGQSYKQVQRFIRLTELIKELLNMVDKKALAFNPAVELSYLTKEEQINFLEVMEMEQNTPSLSQAQRIKKLSQEGNCTIEAMQEIMMEVKKEEQDRVTIKNDVLKKYFPKSYTPKQMEDTIIKLLDNWHKKRQRNMER